MEVSQIFVIIAKWLAIILIIVWEYSSPIKRMWKLVVIFLKKIIGQEYRKVFDKGNVQLIPTLVIQNLEGSQVNWSQLEHIYNTDTSKNLLVLQDMQSNKAKYVEFQGY